VILSVPFYSWHSGGGGSARARAGGGGQREAELKAGRADRPELFMLFVAWQPQPHVEPLLPHVEPLFGWEMRERYGVGIQDALHVFTTTICVCSRRGRTAVAVIGKFGCHCVKILLPILLEAIC